MPQGFCPIPKDRIKVLQSGTEIICDGAPYDQIVAQAQAYIATNMAAELTKKLFEFGKVWIVRYNDPISGRELIKFGVDLEVIVPPTPRYTYSDFTTRTEIPDGNTRPDTRS